MKKGILEEKSKFFNGVENGDFWQNSKGGTMGNFGKWPIFWANFGRLNNKKYKSQNTLTSMD